MKVIWKGPIEERRIELLKKGYKYHEIAAILSREFNKKITYDAVQGRCKTSKITKKTIKKAVPIAITNTTVVENLKHFDNIDVLNLSQLDISNNDNLFPDDINDDYYESEISLTPQKIKILKEIYTKFTNLKPKKILSLSDLHSPFIDFLAVQQAILDNLDADLVILNGDIYDGHAMSNFDKMKDINFKLELKKVEKLLDVITTKFKYIIWVGGNHDLHRFEKFIAKNCGGMKEFFFETSNPMEYLAKKYNNLIVIPHNWVQIGDVIFSHPSDFSTVEMKTVVTTEDKFRSMKHLLPNPNYRAVIIGHTHQLGQMIKNDILLMEQGKLCHLYDYKFNKPSKIKWQTGYAVIEFDENVKVDFNKTKMIYIEK